MAVREKPVTKQEEAVEAKAMKFIQKGGTSAGEKNGKGTQAVNIKVPVSLLKRIDRAVSKRELPIYRVQWILEAISEKLEREPA
ncbi:MAG: hypothetical protein ACRENF_04310 [Thermodesulfobacteriota bacterium]